jgi:hypothetical protein
MLSSPLSRNCLQLMVERSSTTAFAGTADSIMTAANSIDPMDFMGISSRETLATTLRQQPDSRVPRQRDFRANIVNET